MKRQSLDQVLKDEWEVTESRGGRRQRGPKPRQRRPREVMVPA
jgi:hypothetical protein